MSLTFKKKNTNIGDFFRVFADQYTYVYRDFFQVEGTYVYKFETRLSIKKIINLLVRKTKPN